MPPAFMREESLIVLLDCIKEALVAKATRPLLQSAPLGETICDVAQQAMDEWKRREPNPEWRRTSLEVLAQTFDGSDRLQTIANSVRPPDLQRPLRAYLGYIPATIRRSFARSDDPDGHSAPPNLPLDEARHLLPFLPQRAPRFQRGDQPLKGVNLYLDTLLGVGGFGEVWKAYHDRGTGIRLTDKQRTPVALKFCLEADAVEVLRHEESVLGQVMKHGGHRGLVRLRHAHLNTNPPCLEYEYVEGDDLGRQLRLWAGTPANDASERGLRLMWELVDIVAAAHRLDPPVVHRDLKPANILLHKTTNGQRVRVTDFGIGGLATRQAKNQTKTRRSQEAYLLTRLSGAYTPLYASQEQMKGADPSPQDDVHALGVIWYQLLLGDLSAKPTPDWNLILQEHGVSPEVIDLVGRCLASPKRRLSSAVQLARELERLVPPEMRSGFTDDDMSEFKLSLNDDADEDEFELTISEDLFEIPALDESDSGSQVINLDDDDDEASLLTEVDPDADEAAAAASEQATPSTTPEGVLHSPIFNENLITFGCSIGLALQALQRSRFTANLRPAEVGWLQRLRQKWHKWWIGSSRAAWGIDLGQCALKALRLQEIDGRLAATAFDYIEYPRILSQPGTNPNQLIRDALVQLLSRNNLHGAPVAIGVPNQSGLVRFFKLPSINEKKLLTIINFEAKQLIPFPLEEVVWDYQDLSKAKVVDGFLVDPEIGLFAMKRDNANRYLKWFKEVGIDVDVVQMAPLALGNFVAYDLLGKDADTPHEGDQTCIAALDIGTDWSDLVVTDGGRIIWQRPIPLGGNHFTRALAKELKLTFASAEQLKRNARQLQGQELTKVLAALKPVCVDFAGEVQRSLGYFANTHRKVRIEYLLALGNAFRLPGLQRFLADKLQLEVRKLERLARLV
jgi:type IV pilus assembly protein PilM